MCVCVCACVPRWKELGDGPLCKPVWGSVLFFFCDAGRRVFYDFMHSVGVRLQQHRGRAGECVWESVCTCLFFFVFFVFFFLFFLPAGVCIPKRARPGFLQCALQHPHAAPTSSGVTYVPYLPSPHWLNHLKTKRLFFLQLGTNIKMMLFLNIFYLEAHQHFFLLHITSRSYEM